MATDAPLTVRVETKTRATGLQVQAARKWPHSHVDKRTRGTKPQRLDREATMTCRNCGMPANGDRCQSCRLVDVCEARHGDSVEEPDEEEEGGEQA
jgi:hypothetical protein